MNPVTNTTLPSTQHRAVYEATYKVFDAAYKALEPVYELLAGL
jgi:hypothetical protein